MRYASLLLLLPLVLASCDTFGFSDDTDGQAQQPQAAVEDAGAPPAQGFGAPVVLASGEVSPRGVAVDEREVFWASEDGDEIRATAKAGGQPVRTVARAYKGGPRDVMLDGATVYWSETRSESGGAGLIRAPKAGGDAAALLGSSHGQVGRRVSLHDRTLYATVRTYNEGESALSVAGDGSSSALFFATKQPTALGAIVSAGPFVFWVTDSGTKIVRLEKPAGPTVDFATKQAVVEDVVTDGSALYWVTNAGVLWTLAVDQAGRPPTQLAGGLAGPQRLAAHGEHLYLILAGDGGVLTVPKAGGEARRLATVSGPRRLAVDASGVYVTTDSGEVVAIPRVP